MLAAVVATHVAAMVLVFTGVAAASRAAPTQLASVPRCAPSPPPRTPRCLFLRRCHGAYRRRRLSHCSGGNCLHWSRRHLVCRTDSACVLAAVLAAVVAAHVAAMVLVVTGVVAASRAAPTSLLSLPRCSPSPPPRTLHLLFLRRCRVACRRQRLARCSGGACLHWGRRRLVCRTDVACVLPRCLPPSLPRTQQ
jgi:hypothetical protein